MPDVVLAAAGDNMTLEMLAAVALLRREAPELRLRVVNVTDLMVLGLHTEHPHGLTEEAFEGLFTADCPVIFNFHGYENAVQALLFERPNVGRFAINGYQEEGTTTTPLDMHIRNRTSRYHLVMQTVQAVPRLNPQRTQEIVAAYQQKLVNHRRYIEQHGEDPADVRDWSWA
jgi:xylulose-5-phosphate/fructose-6-phosphate phosphoketolase